MKWGRAAQPRCLGRGVIEPRGSRVGSPARVYVITQFNDLLIGRGSFLTFARSYSGGENNERSTVNFSCLHSFRAV